MNLPDLKLEAIHFTTAPTKSQITNTLRSIHDFLGKLGGALILDGSYSIADPPMGALFNGSIQLRQALDGFDNGPNAQGLSVPQMAPQVMRPR